MSGSTVALRDEHGIRLPLEPARWHGQLSAAEHELLAGVTGPVLDIGCGPGRVLETLGRRGVVALGVDPAPTAAALVRNRGCSVLQRSVFDRLPGEGRWATLLLLDGNIGIGGDPSRLLRRCTDLLRSDGTLVVEVERPATQSRSCQARLERDGAVGCWFPWAVVGFDAIGDLASAAGLFVRTAHQIERRWIVTLGRGGVMANACA